MFVLERQQLLEKALLMELEQPYSTEAEDQTHTRSYFKIVTFPPLRLAESDLASEWSNPCPMIYASLVGDNSHISGELEALDTACTFGGRRSL